MFRRPEDYILAVYTTQAWSTSSRVLSLEPLRPVVTSYTTQPTQNTIISLICYFYNRNSSVEIRHYFPCFCKKERKLQPILPKNEIFTSAQKASQTATFTIASSSWCACMMSTVSLSTRWDFQIRGSMVMRTCRQGCGTASRTIFH